MILITIVFIGINLFSVINGKCTKNPNFTEITKNETLFLCETATSCTKDYLTKNATYFGCKGKTGRISPFAIALIELSETNAPYSVIRCFTKAGWVDSMPCKMINVITFLEYPILRMQYYVVICNQVKSPVMFPNENQVQIQIPSMESPNLYRKMSVNATIQSTTTIIPCHSQCIEVIPKFDITYRASDHVDNDIDPIDKSLLRLYYKEFANKSDLDLHLMKYACKSPNVQQWDILFYVGNVYDPLMVNDIEGSKLLTTMDAGMELRCAYILYLEAAKEKIASDETSLKTYIFITRKNDMNMDINETKIGAEKVIIPEFFEENIPYVVNCYFGLYDKRDLPKKSHRYYKKVLTHAFIMGATMKTAIMYSDNVKIKGIDVEDLSHVKCNISHYDQNSSLITDDMIQIGFAYGSKFDVPLSSMYSDVNVTKNISTINDFFFERKKTGLMAFFCIVNNMRTTPLKIFSGERPVMKFTYLFPPWNSTYSLRNFFYGCSGVEVIKTIIICENCSKGSMLEIINGQNFSTVTIPRYFRLNAVLKLLCYGISLKYRSINATLVLNIIAYDINDFNDTYTFFMVGDLFNCVAKFSRTVGNFTQKYSEAMPTMLMSEDQQNFTNATHKMIEIPKNFTSYQGCCLAFKNNKFDCDGNLKDVLVGNSFKIEWSRNLNEVYPYSEISCHACVNYTNKKMVTCTDEHRVNAFIGIHVVRPDHVIEDVTCNDQNHSVMSPRELLKPNNKSYYPMASFKVTVICCVRLKEFKENVVLRSCNENPPFIKIIPPDRRLFVVGDSFSCSTEMLDCLQGLDYTIYISADGNNPTRRNAASIKFTYEHVGNNVRIKCFAGLRGEQVDERVVRVEIAPFNVTISGLLPILWFGRYLKCHAEGFPPPDIFWVQTNGSSLLRVSEYFLLIGPWDFSGNYTVICEAKNGRGVASKKVTFGNYNSRIRFYETSPLFYITIPLLTIIFVILMILSMLLTFQEVFFGCPLFSPHRVNARKNQINIKKNA